MNTSVPVIEVEVHDVPAGVATLHPQPEIQEENGENSDGNQGIVYPSINTS